MANFICAAIWTHRQVIFATPTKCISKHQLLMFEEIEPISRFSSTHNQGILLGLILLCTLALHTIHYEELWAEAGLELPGGWRVEPPVYVYKRSFLSENRL